MSNGNGGTGSNSRIPLIVAVAIVLLVIYLVFVYLLYQQVDTTPEAAWNRLVFLLTGVEAVAFAGAGYLFGREVNRQRADNAEQRAQSNEGKAQRGETLARLVQNSERKSQRDTSRQRYRSLGASDEAIEEAQSDISDLAASARELFPEITS
jgi:uncharacterized protein HemX